MIRTGVISACTFLAIRTARLSLEIIANSDVFLPGNKLLGALDGASDALTASHLLKIDEDGFGTVDFGSILRDGVSLGDLESVFSVSATFDGGEVASAVQFVNLAIVPEPTSGLLLMVPALLLLARRRERTICFN